MKDRFRNIDNYLAVFLLVISLFYYTFQRHVEIVRHDMYGNLKRLWAYGSWNIFPDSFSIDGVLEWAKINLQILFYDAHGPMPGFIIGPFYRFADIIGIPITEKVFHLPMALIAATTVTLFYILLRKNKIDITISIVSSLLLLLSPLFSSMARSLAAYHILIVMFNQVLALLVLSVYKDTKRYNIIIGLVILQIAMSDTIFLFTIFVLLASYYLQNIDIYQLLKNPKLSLLKSIETIPSLYRKAVFMPVMIWVSILSIATALRYFNVLSISTSFLRILQKTSPGYRVNQAGFIDILESISLMWGELFVFLLPLFLLFLFYSLFKLKVRGILWKYSLIATLSYSILVYVIFRGTGDALDVYQSFIIVPSLLFIVLLTDLYLKKGGRFSRYVLSLFYILMIVSVSIGNISYNFKKPYRILFDKIYSKDRNYHSVRERVGIKATGFLIREVVEIAANKQVADSIRVRSTNLPYPLRVYGNLLNTSSGYRITRQFGIQVNIQDRNIESDPGIADKYSFISCSADLDRSIVVLDLVGYNKDVNSSSLDVLKYDVLLDGMVLYSIYVVLNKSEKKYFPDSGNFDCLDLEKAYDSKYNRLADYFS